jgi:hypothetical protein
VDDNHSATAEFRSLDVLRWLECPVPAAGAQRRDDVLAAFQSELSKLIGAHDGLPLAVRVRIGGRTAIHDSLLADVARLTGEIRAAALDVGGSSVWIEKVRIETTPAGQPDAKHAGDGPIGELLALIRESKSSDDAIAALRQELEELSRKLPEDLTAEPGGLRLLDRAELRSALDEVQSLLLDRLEMAGAGA